VPPIDVLIPEIELVDAAADIATFIAVLFVIIFPNIAFRYLFLPLTFYILKTIYLSSDGGRL